jgi:hypothetical protein
MEVKRRHQDCPEERLHYNAVSKKVSVKPGCSGTGPSEGLSLYLCMNQSPNEVGSGMDTTCRRW